MGRFLLMDQLNIDNDNWYFFFVRTKKKYGPYTLLSICEFIIDEKISLDQIYLSRPKWEKWKKSSEVAEFSIAYNAIIKLRNENIPNTNQNKTDIDLDQTQTTIQRLPQPETKTHQQAEVELEAESEAYYQEEHEEPIAKETVEDNYLNDEQQSFYLNYPLKIVIIAGHQCFKTKIATINYKEIYLEEEIPDHYAETLMDFYITSPNSTEVIKLRGHLDSNYENLSRLKLGKSEIENINKISKWFESKSKTKKAA